MEKLLGLTPFSAGHAAIRPVRPPSESSIERQKLLAQQDARLWELRKDRLDAGNTARTYDIVRHRGAWRVLHLGKHSSGYASQQAAISAAVATAKGDAALGRVVRVRLIRTDGRAWPINLATGAA